MHAILEVQYIVAFEVAMHCHAKLVPVAEHSKTHYNAFSEKNAVRLQRYIENFARKDWLCRSKNAANTL
jgi:hypothetical protein